MPLPAGERGGSLYETQMMMEKRIYTVPAMAQAPAKVTAN